MSYSSISPLSAFTTVPSTWLAQLLANTVALHDGSGFASAAIPSSALNFGGAGAGIWWEEIGRTTLGTAGTTIDVSGLPGRNYLTILVHAVATGGNIDSTLTFNNDTGSNYAFRYSPNYGTETASVSQTGIPIESGSEDNHHFTSIPIENFATLEKIYSFCNIRAATAGASTNVQTLELRGKWANSSSRISRVTLTTSSANFAIGSEIIVLGHN